MNKFLSFVCFVVIGVTGIRAGETAVEEKIKAIRAHYSEIEGSLKRCKQVKRDLAGESAEGGELIGYLQDRTVRKLSATFMGETGKAVEEYYFWENQLIFVHRVESNYTKPMSGVVKNKTEERFNFPDGKLIHWLDAQGKDAVTSAEKATREGELLASAKKYSALVAR